MRHWRQGSGKYESLLRETHDRYQKKRGFKFDRIKPFIFGKKHLDLLIISPFGKKSDYFLINDHFAT
jgi:hypothetical protein